jgi:hypothetical protein
MSGAYEHGNELSSSIKGGTFLDRVSDNQFCITDPVKAFQTSVSEKYVMQRKLTLTLVINETV